MLDRSDTSFLARIPVSVMPLVTSQRITRQRRSELFEAVEKIVDRGIAQTPTLTVVQRSKKVVGKLSENEKGLTVIYR